MISSLLLSLFPSGRRDNACRPRRREPGNGVDHVDASHRRDDDHRRRFRSRARSPIAAIAFAVLALAASIASAEPTIWEHNDSFVGLSIDGDRFVFRYEQPKASLEERGVLRGTLLLDGVRRGVDLTGTARVFSRSCGPMTYAVSGQVLAGGTMMILRGMKPTAHDGRCRTTTTEPDELRFHLAGPSVAEMQRRAAARPFHDDYVEVHKRCNPPNNPASLAETEAAIAGCRELLAHPAPTDYARRQYAEHLTALTDHRDRLGREAEQRERADRERAAEIERIRSAAEQSYRKVKEHCLSSDDAGRRIEHCQAALTHEARPASDAQMLRDALRTSEAEWRAGLRRCLAGCPECDLLPTRDQVDRGFVDCAIALSAHSRTNVSEDMTLRGHVRWLEQALACRNAPSLDSCGDTLLRHPRYATPVQLGLGLLALSILALLAVGGRRGPPWIAARVSALAKSVSGEAQARARKESATPAVSNAEPAKVTAAAPAPPPEPRDPERAQKALRLAYAYLQELEEAPSHALTDPLSAKAHRSTLALASKQLDTAQRADPTAVFTTESAKDHMPLSFTQAQLRAHALTIESHTWSQENAGRAIRLATQATEVDPGYASAWYMLGALHFDERNRARAVAALERALALDPDNIEYLKLLDRAKHITGAEIATYKATKAGTTTVAAGIKTWRMLQIAEGISIFLLFGAFFVSLALGNYVLAGWLFALIIGGGLILRSIDTGKAAVRAWWRTNTGT